MPKTVTCVDIDGNQHEVPADQITWRPAAYGIVLKGNTVLLSPQFDGHDLPGGGLDIGETPEEAVIREVKEETGIDVKNPQLVLFNTSFFRHSSGQAVEALQFYYRCEAAGGELSMDGFDEQEKQYARLAEWVPLAELDKLVVKASYDWRDLIKKTAKL